MSPRIAFYAEFHKNAVIDMSLSKINKTVYDAFAAKTKERKTTKPVFCYPFLIFTLFPMGFEPPTSWLAHA